jgi:succinate dehydrogenase / fumarate reductase cytochrome b subunit
VRAALYTRGSGQRRRLPHLFLFVVSDLLYSIVWVLCPATLANANSPELRTSAMSAAVVNPVGRAARFYEAPIGKKAVMAITGFMLVGYVLAHMLGNLQIYSSNPNQINTYAAFLHNPASAGLLWGARTVLLLAVVLHITAAVQLFFQNRAARPIGYVKKDDVPASYAARTMVWSGPIVAAFVIFHVLHLTVGAVLPLRDVADNPITPDVRANVIAGFQNYGVSAFYIFAMILLCMHLYHGIWSMCQSLGVSHPRYTRWLKKASAVLAILIAIGNCSIPIAVMAGWLTDK